MSLPPEGGARPKTHATLTTPSYQRDSHEDSDSELESRTTRNHAHSRRSPDSHRENPTNYVPGSACDCSTYNYGGISLKVYMTDITKATTDAVVSSENKFLKSKAPLAVLISSAAGTQYQENLQALRREHPKSRYGEVFVAKSGGHSSWKFVILAVVPRWAEERVSICKRNLYTTFTNVFDTADNNGAETISLPVLGTGNRLAPAGEVMEIFCQALKDFSRRASHLREIHLVSLDPSIKVMAVECCDRTMTSDLTGITISTGRLALREVTPRQRTVGMSSFPLLDDKPITRKADDSSDICSICLEYVKTYYREELACKHAFCVGCIRKWFDNCRSCPVCRNTSV